MLASEELALNGVHIALPTPFTADGDVDNDAFAALCSDVLAAAPTSIVVGTPLGERSVLELAERRALAKSAAALAHGGPLVLVDVSTTDWRRSGSLAADAAENGADAVLLSAPTDHRPSPRELLDHVRSVAAHGLPVILVNDPASTRIALDVLQVQELAQLEGVVGIIEVADDQELVAGLRRSDASLPVLIGRDEHVLSGRRAGGVGWLTNLGCVLPSLVLNLWHAVATDGDAEPPLLARLDPLLRRCSGPAAVTTVKLLLELLDRAGGGAPRPPRRGLEGSDRDDLARVLALLLASEQQKG